MRGVAVATGASDALSLAARRRLLQPKDRNVLASEVKSGTSTPKKSQVQASPRGGLRGGGYRGGFSSASVPEAEPERVEVLQPVPSEHIIQPTAGSLEAAAASNAAASNAAASNAAASTGHLSTQLPGVTTLSAANKKPRDEGYRGGFSSRAVPVPELAALPRRPTVELNDLTPKFTPKSSRSPRWTYFSMRTSSSCEVSADASSAGVLVGRVPAAADEISTDEISRMTSQSIVSASGSSLGKGASSTLPTSKPASSSTTFATEVQARQPQAETPTSISPKPATTSLQSDEPRPNLGDHLPNLGGPLPNLGGMLELSAKPSIDSELLRLRSEFETSSVTYEREIEGLKRLEALLDKQGRRHASPPSFTHLPSNVPSSNVPCSNVPSNVPSSPTNARETPNAPVQHVTSDHEPLSRDRPYLGEVPGLPNLGEVPVRRSTPFPAKVHSQDRSPQMTLQPMEQEGLTRRTSREHSGNIQGTSREHAKQPLSQTAFGLVEPFELERWKEEREALDEALGRLVGRPCTDAELAHALGLLLASKEPKGVPIPSTTPATTSLLANSLAPPLSEIQPEPPPGRTAPASVARKTREIQRRLSGYRGVFSSAPGATPAPQREQRAALATALGPKPEGVKMAVGWTALSRVVASWGHRGYRGGLRRESARDAVREIARDPARAAPLGGGYTGGFSMSTLLEASSAEAQAMGAELPARAEIMAETHAAAPEGERVSPLTPPPTPPPRTLSATASHATASHVITSRGDPNGDGTSRGDPNGDPNGDGTSPELRGPRGLQLLELLAPPPAEVMCLDDDGQPMRIVWDVAGHPVRSPAAAVGAGAPGSSSIVREDEGEAERISTGISTEANADRLLPRSPSRLCLDFLGDALVSPPRSPSRLQLDDDADGVATAAGAGVHEVAIKAWSAVVSVWRGLARGVLHAAADTSVADAEVGSSIAPADGPLRFPLRFPLGTADKLRGAALDLVLGRFVRKLCNLALSRAFNSWAERWGERTYAMARVRACAGRVALQRLVDAFGFWARPPEWVWKSLEYHDEVCNQGRDISWIEVPWVVPWVPKGNRMAYRQCLGLCLADARASIATLRYVHTRRSPLATCHAAVESSLVLRSSLRTCIPHMPHAGVESR